MDILAQLAPALAGIALASGLWLYLRHLKAALRHDREVHPAE